MKLNSRVLLCAGLVAISGCVGVPNLSYFNVPVHDVVLNIKCELRDAFWDFSQFDPDAYPTMRQRNAAIGRIKRRFSSLKNLSASVDLNLQVLQTDTAAGNAAVTFPLMPAGVAVLTANGSTSGAATRSETLVFDETLTDKRRWLKGAAVYESVEKGRSRDKSERFVRVKEKQRSVTSLKYTTLCDDHHRYKNMNRLLAGRLGIEDFFRRVDETNRRAGVSARGLSYNVKFVVVASSDIGPSFSMIPLSKDMFGGGATLTSKRDDTHDLTIGFSALEPYSATIPVTAVVIGAEQPGMAFDTRKTVPDRGIDRVYRRDTGPAIPSINQRQNDLIIQREILRSINPR